MIKQIRELTGLSHEQLGTWLGASKSMVQFAEFSFRSFRGDASKKLAALAPVVQQLQDAAGALPQPQPVVFTGAAIFAAKHKDRMEHHRGLADEQQRRLDKLKLKHVKLTARFALFDAMKRLDTELYRSTEADKHMVEQLEYLSRDHLDHIAAKMPPLQDSIDTHRAYAKAHEQLWEQYVAMGMGACDTPV